MMITPLLQCSLPNYVSLILQTGGNLHLEVFIPLPLPICTYFLSLPPSLSLSYTHRLQKFVDSITSNFREMAPDLMTKEFGRDSVKLHATVMNANFVDHDMESREIGPRNAKKYKINATNVFKVNILKNRGS